MNQDQSNQDLQLRIGQLADLVGVTPKTIRHYHKIGLLPPPERAPNNYRLYSIVDLYRLNLILRLKEVGFSLADIVDILQAGDPDAALERQLDMLAQTLSQQIEKLHQQQQRVQALLAADVSLKSLEQPQAKASLTYQLLVNMLAGYADHTPEAVKSLDQAMLALLDQFHWGEAYESYWVQLAQSLGNDFKPIQVMAETIAIAATLKVDDERLPKMAAEAVAELEKIRPLLTTPNLSPPLQTIFNQMAGHTVNQLLNPAQKRLISLIFHRFHA